MLHLLLFLTLASAFSPDRIPATNPPPDARAHSLMANFPDLNLIMIYGGYSDPTNSIYSDIWSFDLLAETWERLVPSDGNSPAERYSGGAFGVIDRALYCIFGGMSLSGPLNDLWCFQSQGFLWDQIVSTGDVPSPRMRFGFTSFYDENNILQFAVIGGVTLSGVDNYLYILDTSTWAWTKKAPLGDAPSNLEGSALAYYKNKIFAAGGENTFAKISHIETLLYFDLDPSDNKWHNVTSSKTYASRILGGSFLKDSELYLMMGYSIELNSFVSAWYKVNLEDPKYDWSEVLIAEDNYGDLVIDSYGFTFFSETLYIFGGDQKPPIINRLVKFDLSVAPFKFKVYDGDYSPTPRMYHSMQPIGPKLYLFGGLGDNEEIYNDFWAYDVMKGKWSLINPEGSVPPKRYGYASAVSADVMLVWGGYGHEGYLNDGYLYDISSGKWTALEYTGAAPTPRVGACAGLNGWLIFIYGGKTDAGLSDELWTYDITKKEYNLINSGDDEGPGPVWFATCSVSTSQGSFLWVLYGEAEDDIPTNQIFGYFADQDEWLEYNNDPLDTTYSRSRAAVCKPLQRVLVVGGETYGLFPNTEIFYYSTGNYEFTMLGNITDSFFASANTYFQNYFYIHGGGTSASSLLRFSVPSNIFLRLPMWSFCKDNITCNFACSYGSYRTSSNCKICPLGTYSDEFNMTECKKCPEGKYGPHYGATSLEMCYPCPEGEYNSKKGQAHCIDCPRTSICRAGSKTYDYKSYYYYSDSYAQPSIYSADVKEAKKKNLIIEIVVGVVGLVVIIAMAFLRKVEVFLFYFDMYSDKHNHFVGEPMHIKRTKVGGIFGMIFIFLAIIIIGVQIVNYMLNNVYETKSLVPLVVLEQDTPTFEAEFLITVTLMNYGGTCSDGPCTSSYIYSDITGITGSWTTSSCKLEDNGDCILSTVCIKCSVTKQGTFAIKMESTNGYTSGYIVNLTASSSIPHKYSSYKTYVFPDNNYVFIGSDPTTIYYDIIPSYYEDTEEIGSHTGYHVSIEKETHKGSQFKPYELGLAYINYLTIFFDVNNNGLVTTRYYNQKWILLLTALLGSIFGVMGTIGGIMKFAEKNIYALHKRKKHIKYLEQLKKKFKMIKKLRKYPDFKNYIDEESPSSARTGNELTEKDKLNPKK